MNFKFHRPTYELRIDFSSSSIVLSMSMIFLRGLEWLLTSSYKTYACKYLHLCPTLLAKFNSTHVKNLQYSICIIAVVMGWPFYKSLFFVPLSHVLNKIPAGHHSLVFACNSGILVCKFLVIIPLALNRLLIMQDYVREFVF